MEHYHSEFIDVDGTSLHLLYSGTVHEKWLILWSGICMTAEQFAPILSSSSDHLLNVVAIDPPGHGLSEPWHGEFTEQSVQSVWETIARHFEIQQAVIGGHSYGAMGALMGNTMLHHWVDGVVLLDAGYNMPTGSSDDELRKGLDDYLQGYKFDSWTSFLDEEKTHAPKWDEVSEVIARATMTERDGVVSLKVDHESAAKAYLLCSHFSPEKVSLSQKPVLLLRATLPSELNEERRTGTSILATRLTNMEVREVANSGHDVLSDNRDFVVDSVWSFVDRVYC